jgi:molybdenum cofactor biosynthesis enzyme MoaA
MLTHAQTHGHRSDHASVNTDPGAVNTVLVHNVTTNGWFCAALRNARCTKRGNFALILTYDSDVDSCSIFHRKRHEDSLV